MNLTDLKCKTEGCFHFRGARDIYCYCCVTAPCHDFSKEEVERYNKELKTNLYTEQRITLNGGNK